MPKSDPAKKDPHAALTEHADGRDTLEFSEPILHGRLRFGKGEVVKFEDPAAAAYFDVAFNGTNFTDKEPTRVVTDEEMNFDPDDPRENETIDPHTVIARGREGVEAGVTIHGHLTGETGPGEAPLEPHEAVAGAGSEG
jgi:hypothetical protein